MSDSPAPSVDDYRLKVIQCAIYATAVIKVLEYFSCTQLCILIGFSTYIINNTISNLVAVIGESRRYVCYRSLKLISEALFGVISNEVTCKHDIFLFPHFPSV